MTLPDTLESALGEEDAVAQVPLGGEDLLAVTPTRTLVYRADGILSDESVEEFQHGADGLDVSEGRRKATITVDYGRDGERTLKLPANRLDDALHPMLAGILSASEITDPGESVLRTFRFSELTLVITDQRLVKHIGSATWADEYEEFGFDDVTDLGFEEGTVATSVVLTLGGRQERFKAPNERAPAVRETLTEAVCGFHDVGSLEELRVAVGPDETDDSRSDPADFGAGPDPLSTAGIVGSGDDADTATDASTAETPTDATTADATAGSATTDSGSATADGTTSGESNGGSADPTRTTSDSRRAGDEGATRDSRTTGDSPGGSDASSTTVAEIAARDEPQEGEQSPGTDAGAAFEESGFEPAGVEEDELAAEVAALREVVEEQSRQLERQSELVEQLIEELRRGR